MYISLNARNIAVRRVLVREQEAFHIAGGDAGRAGKYRHCRRKIRAVAFLGVKQEVVDKIAPGGQIARSEGVSVLP